MGIAHGTIFDRQPPISSLQSTSSFSHRDIDVTTLSENRRLLAAEGLALASGMHCHAVESIP